MCKREKGVKIGKEEMKLTFFADDVIVYIDSPKESVDNLLELISKFGKPANYKVSK